MFPSHAPFKEKRIYRIYKIFMGMCRKHEFFSMGIVWASFGHRVGIVWASYGHRSCHPACQCLCFSLKSLFGTFAAARLGASSPWERNTCSPNPVKCLRSQNNDLILETIHEITEKLKSSSPVFPQKTTVGQTY